jgi:hypothetical protein
MPCKNANLCFSFSSPFTSVFISPSISFICLSSSAMWHFVRSIIPLQASLVFLYPGLPQHAVSPSTLSGRLRKQGAETFLFIRHSRGLVSDCMSAAPYPIFKQMYYLCTENQSHEFMDKDTRTVCVPPPFGGSRAPQNRSRASALCAVLLHPQFGQGSTLRVAL